MAAKKAGGIKSLRKRINVTLPPVKLGWANFAKPDDRFDEDNPSFSINCHYSEDELAAVIQKLQPAADKALAAFAKQEGATPKKSEIDAEAWVEDKMKTASEKETFGDFLKFASKLKEGVSQKTGEPYRIRPNAWDLKGNLLDADNLHLGRGSIILPVVGVGVYVPVAPKVALLTIQLVGIVVVKASERTIKGAPEFDAEALMAEYDIDEDDADLSAFAGAKSDATAKDSDGPDEDDGFEVDEADPFA